jgi:hypothetical protein
MPKSALKSHPIALDICRLNDASDPFFGAETKIPERGPTHQEIVAALVGTDSDQREAEDQLDDTSRADFAPCCMTFCKALEISLRELSLHCTCHFPP